MKLVLALLFGLPIAAQAADQTVLGSLLVLKNPGTPAQRKIAGRAREVASSATIVGDPAANGATLTISADGGASQSETYDLPVGASTRTGRRFWTGDAAEGFRYRDPKGENGPVRGAQIKLARGVFQIKTLVSGELGPVAVVPPNPGTNGCLLLAIAGGDSYSVAFGTGRIDNDGPKLFKVSKPTVAGTCVTGPVCGDGSCNGNESCATCCMDCGVCAVECGNGVCEEGETATTCAADCHPAQAVVLPIALGECFFTTFENSDPPDCSLLPTFAQVPNVTNTCWTSLADGNVTQADLVKYFPTECCGSGGICGSNEPPPPLNVGSSIGVVNGQVDPILKIIKSCFDQGINEYVVPLIPCGTCNQETSVTGFAHIVVSSVRPTGGNKGLDLSTICGGTCGDGACTSGESCSSCAADCGGCPTTCP
jgi:hypothetical protein